MSAVTPIPPKNSRPPVSRKEWLFRGLALFGIPVLLILSLEGGLRLAGYGRPAEFLIPDDRPGFYRSNPDFAGFFMPGNFELRPLDFRIEGRKPANTVRIVVLGESAAQGVPAPAFGFAPQLRAQLRARYPGREIEVINTGIVAVNSHVVYQIARQMAQISPDLFVVYLGNNEVVGPYGPGCAYRSEMPPLWVIRLSMGVKSSRTGQLLGAVIGRLRPAAARPMEWGGMAMFVNDAVRGDDPRLTAVYHNFEANLTDIVRAAGAAGAKTILCTVVANLKDSPPFLSLHRPGLTDAELADWQKFFTRGQLAWLLEEDEAAWRDLTEARRRDPQYADAAFLLGTLELKRGNLAAARTLLLEALHWDALRFRPDPEINRTIRRVAQESFPGVSLLDAAAQLGASEESAGPPAGRELLFEHVHFEWEGNYRLARLLAQAAATALGGAGPDDAPWLDATAVAAVLAYTGHERLVMLRHIADIMRKPPFTNQLTYFEDQARLAREIDRLENAGRAPENLQQTKRLAAAAIAADPRNPFLAEIAEGIATDQGDLAGALAQARRAAELLPTEVARFSDQASLLAQQGSFEEAGRILHAAANHEADPDKLAPPFAAYYTRMKKFDEGRAYLDRAIARRPLDARLKVMRGNLERLAGNQAAAEKDFRAVLAADPGNQAALEALVSLLVLLGQTDAGEQASLVAADHQTTNQLNNLRVAKIHESRGDEVQAVKFLQAAERSGPVAAAIEVSIAKQLHRLGRNDEALFYLAKAKRLSILEGDPEITSSIDEVIARLHATGA